MNDARVIEKGYSLKSFFAAAAVLPCRITCGRHIALVEGDSFATGVSIGREFARVKSVSTVRRAWGNALLNMLNHVPF